MEIDLKPLFDKLQIKMGQLQKEKSNYSQCKQHAVVEDDEFREEDEIYEEAKTVLNERHHLWEKTEKMMVLSGEMKMILDQFQDEIAKESQSMDKERQRISKEVDYSVDIMKEVTKRKARKANERLTKEALEISNTLEQQQRELDKMKLRKTPIPMKMEKGRKIDLKETISKLCEMDIKTVLFDSLVNRWNKNDSEFGTNLKGKRNVCIVIHDVEGNVFGAFVSKEIRIEQYHFDSNSFLFSLVKNGVYRMQKYPVKEQQEDLYICEDSSDVLFGFGEDDAEEGTCFRDICVHKRDCGKKNYCEQHCCKYYSEKGALCGKEKFQIKQFVVYEMIEGTMMRKRREQKEQQEHQNDLKRWEEEQEEVAEAIQNMFAVDIGDVLFDSEVNNWNVNQSEFDSAIEGKRNILVLVEDERNNLFGGYIGTEVRVGKVTDDDDCLLFSLKKDGVFDPRSFDYERGHSFLIFPQSNDYLFVFGLTEDGYYKDLAIRKKDCGGGFCKQHSFEYNDNHHSLCGKTRFNVKRIVVYQIKESQSFIDGDMSSEMEE